MTTVACKAVHSRFNDFVDGELAGAEMLRVSQHLETCESCADTVAGLRGLGSLLREAASVEAAVPPMLGLAGGVVARIAAEESQSWRALLHRGVDDWHWVIVGGGSVAATFVSVVFAAVLLLFGPVPVREDSLSALISNLGAPAGRLLIEATQGKDTKDARLIEIETGDELTAAGSRVMPVTLGLPTERDLVGFLTTALTPQGHLVDLASMPADERRYTESILDSLSRFRLGESTVASASPLSVYRIRLVTNTAVSAKME